jgi:hypothetical protein
METASFYLSGAENFEVAGRILENLSTSELGNFCPTFVYRYFTPPPPAGFIKTHTALIRSRIVQSRMNSPVFTASFISRGEINLWTSRYKIGTPISWKITGCQKRHDIYIDPIIARVLKTLMFRCAKTVLIYLTSPNTNSRPTRSYSVPVTSLGVFEELCVWLRISVILEMTLGRGMSSFRWNKRIAFTVKRWFLFLPFDPWKWRHYVP